MKFDRETFRPPGNLMAGSIGRGLATGLSSSVLPSLTASKGVITFLVTSTVAVALLQELHKSLLHILEKFQFHRLFIHNY